MSEYTYEADDPPFADTTSVLYAEQSERWHMGGEYITPDMSAEETARILAKVHPDNYFLINLITELGRIPV